MAETAKMQRIFFKIAMKAKNTKPKDKTPSNVNLIPFSVAEINLYNILFASNNYSGRGVAAPQFCTRIIYL